MKRLMTLPGVRVRPLGGDLEEDDQCNQGEDHAELAGVAAKELLERVHCVSPCSGRFWRIPEGQAVFSGGGHQFHQAFLAGFVFVQDAGDGAFEDGVDAVGEAQQLGQFGGDDDDALALVGQLLDDAVDLVLGADVDAAGGFVQDQQVRVGEHPLGQDHLLLVAAGELGHAFLHGRASWSAATCGTARPP